MSEPWIPLPDPESNPYFDPTPARCPECGSIIDAHPASRKDGRWEGWCPRHGTVVAAYRISQISEIPTKEEDDDDE